MSTTHANVFAAQPSNYEGSQQTFDSKTNNYPQEGDTTSSGGYGASPDVWSNKSQRGGQDPYRHHKTNSTGAIQQSLSGTDLTSGLDDAKQGSDSIMTEADV